MDFSMEKEGGGKAGNSRGCFPLGSGIILGKCLGKVLWEGVRCLEQDFGEDDLGRGFRKCWEGVLGRFLGKAFWEGVRCLEQVF